MVISPFFGSGAAEFELVRSRRHIRIQGSDLDGPLVDFWQALLASPGQVAQQIRKMVPSGDLVSKREFDKMASTLTSPGRASSALKAARFWLLNFLSFHGSMRPLVYAERQAKRLCDDRDMHLKHIQDFEAIVPPVRMSVTMSDCFSVIDSSPQTAMLLLDPPYLSSLRRRMYNGAPNWDIKMHRRLRATLDKRERWLLCHSDCIQIREMYKGFRMIEHTATKPGTKLEDSRPELIIVSHWVSQRLPNFGESMNSPCSRCGGHRGLARAQKKDGRRAIVHKCPLAAFGTQVPATHKCAICDALLPPFKQAGQLHRSRVNHEAHCKEVFPNLWKEHRGPSVVHIGVRFPSSSGNAIWTGALSFKRPASSESPRNKKPRIAQAK